MLRDKGSRRATLSGLDHRSLAIHQERPVSRQAAYNLQPGECRWPTHLAGNDVQNCNFGFKPVASGEYQVVELPPGTTLYHTTFASLRAVGTPWWDTMPPTNTTSGGVFFTSSRDHQSAVNGTHLLEYVTDCSLYLLYIQNLSAQLGFAVGNDFVRSSQYPRVLDDIQREDGITVAGYVGCNECEIFLHNEDIRRCVATPPVAVVPKSTYMD